ncbi:MAG TPA: iron-siderophore ABC transporter substrate-binding protein [Pseudonocardia sp.]|nr:iron-siderophore ABC transporter substrate-binding protein [Pseudonocardia sp.]
MTAPRLLRTLGALLLATVLAACGAGAADRPAAEPAPTGGPFPVTIEHAFGTTTIERAPERVVTLGVTDADPVLALGITPVAVTGYSYYPETGLGPWAQELVRGPQPTRLASDSTPDLEQVAVLEPDLIIGISAGFDQAVYDRLSALAPTIARPAGTAAYTVPRDEATRTIATALGKTEEGEALVRRTDAAFAEAAAAHPEFQGRTGTVVLPYEGQYGAYLPGDARGRFMAELGFELPAELAARDTGESYFVEVSREQVGLLDGDVLVMLADDPAARAFVEGDEVLQALPVVQEGRMVVPDTDTRGAMTYNSVISVPYALDRLVPALADAVGRLPAG